MEISRKACGTPHGNYPTPSLKKNEPNGPTDTVTLNSTMDSQEFRMMDSFVTRLGHLANKRINNVPLPEERQENVPVTNPEDQGIANFVERLGRNRLQSMG